MGSSTKKSMPDDQKYFRHNHDIYLERFAENMFGKAYYKSADRIDIAFWKKFYLRALEVLDTSIFRNIGSIDGPHRQDIQDELDFTITTLRGCKSKDEIHSILIVGLFKLLFLVLGRLPYRARGKFRSLSTFRTLTYSQSEEQLSWLLQGYIQRKPEQHGYSDHFDADYAFHCWARENKRSSNDRTAYVAWVRANFPETIALFK